MAFIITNDSKEVLFQEHLEFHAEKIHSSTLIEEWQQVDYHFGKAHFRETFFDGFHITFGDAQVLENLHIRATEMPSLVSLFFVVHGDFVAGIDGIGGKRRFMSLEHNLLYSPCDTESTDVKKQHKIEVVGLSFTKERFLQLAENSGRVLDGLAACIAVDRPVLLNRGSNHRITSKMLLVLNDIRNCQFTGGVKKLFLQSKIIELLALQCEQHERAAELRTEKTILSAGDRERIYHARDLLLSQMQAPPSLHELARQAGLNEFKLKNGFREVFDNTVFGYLNEHRLEYAQQLVKEQGQSLTDIADALGYSSIQHFSNAFRKKYGVSPVKMRRL